MLCDKDKNSSYPADVLLFPDPPAKTNNKKKTSKNASVIYAIN